MPSFSSNPFALLSGDSDDEGVAHSKTPVSSKPKAADSTPVKKTAFAPTNNQRKDSRPARGEYPHRGASRNVYRSPPSGADENLGEPSPKFGLNDRSERRGGGGRGRGRGRGGGRGRFEDRPDRHSASGIQDTHKKIASGWGADEGIQELKAETEGWGDAVAESSEAVLGNAGITADNGDDENDGWGKQTEETTAAATGAVVETPPALQEDIDNTKTLEEYYAEKATATRLLPIRETRKLNEGVDDSKWKNAIELSRNIAEEELYFIGGGKDKKAPSGTKKIKGKTFIEVEPLSYRPARSGGERGRGGRGGRGRGEGGGGRGRGGRGTYSSSYAGHRSGHHEFDAEDATAFPSLS